jgi:cytochrome b subunit of formate dehydrogenase
MEKASLNYWIDILLVICLIVVAISGLVLYLAFVSGEPKIGRTVTFLGTHKSDWQPWHNYFGLAMLVLLILHLILHFGWLMSMTKSLFDKKEKP